MKPQEAFHLPRSFFAQNTIVCGSNVQVFVASSILCCVVAFHSDLSLNLATFAHS